MVSMFAIGVEGTEQMGSAQLIGTCIAPSTLMHYANDGVDLGPLRHYYQWSRVLFTLLTAFDTWSVTLTPHAHG